MQIINEYEQGTNFIEYTGFEKIEYYKLNSLYELRNRILVSCNSYGLKFYSKQNDKYVLISKEEIEFEVENIFEMKENIFILFQKKSKTYTSKSIPPRSTITNKYRISLYNIKNKEEKILIEDIAYFNSESGIKYHRAFSKINYMFKDKYLFISLPTKIYIYDISQNKQLIEENEITIKFLCNYFNDLIIAKDLITKTIKIYHFKNGILKFYNDFPVQDCKKILKINNYDFLTYSKNQIKVFEIKQILYK